MFNSFISIGNGVVTPVLTFIDQCGSGALVTLTANGNSTDGITKVLLEQETFPGNNIWVQTGVAALTRNNPTLGIGTFTETNYRIRLSRNGLVSGYSVYDNTANATISVCNPPINVFMTTFAGQPALQFDDDNIIGQPAYSIVDSLGGHYGGTVPHHSLNNVISLQTGAVHASIFMTLRCFQSTTVNV